MSFTLNAVAQAKGSHSNTGANDSAEPLNTTRSRSRTPGAKGGVSPTSSHHLFSREPIRANLLRSVSGSQDSTAARKEHVCSDRTYRRRHPPNTARFCLGRTEMVYRRDSHDTDCPALLQDCLRQPFRPRVALVRSPDSVQRC